MKPLVGIPTLKRYDLLERCLNQLLDEKNSLVPERVFIIDNGGKFVTPVRHYGKISLIQPRRNLGVAGSWNMLGQLTRPAPLILMNDDIFVGPKTIEMLATPPGPAIVTGEGWALFRQDPEVWDIVGPYDTNFFPAYFEDNDMDLRRKLCGVERIVLENDVRPTIEHVCSATVAAMNPQERAELDARHAFSTQYYKRKWGDLPGREQFTYPFNGVDQNGSEKALVRSQVYRQAVIEPSDIQNHIPTLCALARKCTHVTSVGGSHRSLVALLNAQPARLVSMLAASDEMMRLEQCSERTKLIFGLEEIETTDLLFIDGVHTYEVVSGQLNILSPAVRKYIVLHDTVTYGETGEDGKSPGIWKAVTDFIAASGKWKTKVHYTDSNGLTVLEKA